MVGEGWDEGETSTSSNTANKKKSRTWVSELRAVMMSGGCDDSAQLFLLLSTWRWGGDATGHLP